MTKRAPGGHRVAVAGQATLGVAGGSVGDLVPAEQATLLLVALDGVEADLAAGAVVVLGRGRARVRRPPID